MAELPAGDSTGEVGRPDSWIFLSGDPASVELPPSALADKKAARSKGDAGARGKWTLVAAVAGVIALYIWDDLLLAAPVIAVARWLGIWPSFVIFSAVYGLGSFVFAMIAIRSYEKLSTDAKSPLAKFIQSQTAGRRGKYARRMVEGGKLLGFVVSSIALGGIATTWLIRYAGRTEGIARIGAFSCAIFGVGFAATYTGVAAIIF